MTSRIAIELHSTDGASIATKSQLERVLDEYDLRPWLHTTNVVIDAKTVPHSHPVLTLHTRHLRNDDLLLATFLHEQLHWFLVGCPESAVASAFDDFRTAFPDVPTGFPDGGKDEESTYLHLIVNYLEFEAVSAVVGPERARAVLEFWASDHYRWIYRMVLERGEEIRVILKRHALQHPATAV